MDEKIIVLEKIDHSKNDINEALGVTEEEFKESAIGILMGTEEDAKKFLAKVQPVSSDKLIVLIKKYRIRTQQVVAFWKKRNYDQVTLKEFVKTMYFLGRFKDEVTRIGEEIELLNLITGSLLDLLETMSLNFPDNKGRDKLFYN